MMSGECGYLLTGSLRRNNVEIYSGLYSQNGIYIPCRVKNTRMKNPDP